MLIGLPEGKMSPSQHPLKELVPLAGDLFGVVIRAEPATGGAELATELAVEERSRSSRSGNRPAFIRQSISEACAGVEAQRSGEQSAPA